MTERFGALEFPVPAAGEEESLSDPCLDTVLRCLVAVMNEGPLAQAWAIAAPKTPKPVNQAYAGDPALTNFGAADLPALFLWRSSRGAASFLADDYMMSSDSLSLIWCFPKATRELKGRLDNVVNALTKLIAVTIYEGRHPAWIDTGDTEPEAQYLGSYLWQRAGVWTMSPGKWSAEPVSIEMDDGSRAPAPYQAIRIPIEIEERYVAPTVDMLAGQATLQIPDDPDPFVTNEVALPMPLSRCAPRARLRRPDADLPPAVGVTLPNSRRGIMPDTSLLVVANPYCALDEDGNPVGALPRADVGGGRLIGAAWEVSPDGARRLAFASEPERLPDVVTFRRWLQHGEIFPADEATAREVGLEWKPVAQALDAAKKAACASFQAAKGRPPAFAIPTTPPAPPAVETTPKAGKAGS